MLPTSSLTRAGILPLQGLVLPCSQLRGTQSRAYRPYNTHWLSYSSHPHRLQVWLLHPEAVLSNAAPPCSKAH